MTTFDPTKPVLRPRTWRLAVSVTGEVTNAFFVSSGMEFEEIEVIELTPAVRAALGEKP